MAVILTSTSMASHFVHAGLGADGHVGLAGVFQHSQCHCR